MELCYTWRLEKPNHHYQRGFFQQLMGTDSEIDCQILGGGWEILQKRERNDFRSQRGQDPTGKQPTESINQS